MTDVFELLRQGDEEEVQDIRGDLGSRSGGLILRRTGRRPRVGGWPSSAPTRMRPWPRSSGRAADRFALEITFRDLQGGCRSRPAAGAVRVGKHRCIPHLPLDLHDDRGMGLEPLGGRTGRPHAASPWDDPNRRPSHADKRRAWRRGIAGRRNSRAFYAAGSPSGKFERWPSGCSP